MPEIVPVSRTGHRDPHLAVCPGVEVGGLLVSSMRVPVLAVTLRYGFIDDAVARTGRQIPRPPYSISFPDPPAGS